MEYFLTELHQRSVRTDFRTENMKSVVFRVQPISNTLQPKNANNRFFSLTFQSKATDFFVFRLLKIKFGFIFFSFYNRKTEIGSKIESDCQHHCHLLSHSGQVWTQLLTEIKTELPIFFIFSKMVSKQGFSFIECKIECFQRDDLKVVRFHAKKA